ncbi:MAG: LytTR family transcriptional regulator DNA-binding domain-containing protein, partial [Bacteroidales bacterium]|nr:LytTR family transcriptional regulator DNA-binding domain-containing protein [Bacteroidales bacterium]
GPRQITFFSDRKSVTLSLDEIAYIESNDTEVSIVTREGRSYRNKTGISQWENLLGETFVRIHRSYLVNRACITEIGTDTLLAAGTELPISRKYRKIL